MQAALNPALAAALTLDQAAQFGEFSPVTKDGKTTVVGGLMQKVMPPAVPDVAQQAGLGGQIQAMRIQEAQKALMNQAMQQTKGPAGIEGLQVPMGNFAEGGIVGYSNGGGTRENMNPFSAFLRKLAAMGVPTRSGKGVEQDAIDIETARAMQAPVAEMPVPEILIETPSVQSAPQATKVPTAPSAASPSSTASPQSVAAFAELARNAYGEMASAPATSEQILEREQQKRAVYDQFLRSQGIEPDAFAKRSEEDKAMMDRQRALLRERMEREQGRDTFIGRLGEALRGFKQMKGQGIGTGILGSEEALSRRVAGTEARMDQFRDMEIRLNELEITRRRALDDSRRATAEGRWKDAERALATEQAASNEIKKLQASTYMPQAQAMVQERQAQEAGAARRAEQQNVEELYRLRLNTLTGGKPPTDEQKMEAREYALQAVKGAGSAARTAMAGQRLTLDQLRSLQKTYAEQAENMLLPQAQRDQAAELLKQVNNQIATSAGIATPPTKGGPAPGTVMDGYRFKGGNPADKANWEKV